MMFQTGSLTLHSEFPGTGLHTHKQSMVRAFDSEKNNISGEDHIINDSK